MSSLPQAENQRRNPESRGDGRLSPALSVAVIAALSALSWEVLIVVVLALLR